MAPTLWCPIWWSSWLVHDALGVYAVAPDGALTLTATVHGLPAYDGSNGMEGIVAT